MKIILVSVYGVVAAFLLLCGWVYPSLAAWSHYAALACGFYGLLSVGALSCRISDAAIISAICWNGISGVVSIGLLLGYAMTQAGFWFLAVAALGGFSLLVMLVFAMVLKATKKPDEEHSSRNE